MTIFKIIVRYILVWGGHTFCFTGKKNCLKKLGRQEMHQKIWWPKFNLIETHSLLNLKDNFNQNNYSKPHEMQFQLLKNA